METVYILGAILVFTAIAICWTLLRNRTRTRQMSRAAESQGFSFEPDGAACFWAANSDGSYTFYNYHSGMVLEDPGNSTSTSTRMDQWTPNGGANQKWTLTRTN